MAKKPTSPTIVTRLDIACHEIEKARNLVIVCGIALDHQNADMDQEVSNVLRTNVSGPLMEVMMELSKICVRLRDHKTAKNLA